MAAFIGWKIGNNRRKCYVHKLSIEMSIIFCISKEFRLAQENVSLPLHAIVWNSLETTFR